LPVLEHGLQWARLFFLFSLSHGFVHSTLRRFDFNGSPGGLIQQFNLVFGLESYGARTFWPHFFCMGHEGLLEGFPERSSFLMVLLEFSVQHIVFQALRLLAGAIWIVFLVALREASHRWCGIRVSQLPQIPDGLFANLGPDKYVYRGTTCQPPS
jgi:hypothetical protein